MKRQLGRLTMQALKVPTIFFSRERSAEYQKRRQEALV